MRIYADNAATTALSNTALAAMTPCFQDVFANPSSLHTPGQRAAEKLLSQAYSRTVPKPIRDYLKRCEEREARFEQNEG